MGRELQPEGERRSPVKPLTSPQIVQELLVDSLQSSLMWGCSDKQDLPFLCCTFEDRQQRGNTTKTPEVKLSVHASCFRQFQLHHAQKGCQRFAGAVCISLTSE